jgi:hypothetical protein
MTRASKPKLRSRSALPITETELKVMAALAIIGLIPRDKARRDLLPARPSPCPA